MDCLHGSYSFTFYAPVTLEELMPCKFANQIAPVISKHSIWFIRIINTVQKKFLWIQDITLWSTREIMCYTLPLTRFGQVTTVSLTSGYTFTLFGLNLRTTLLELNCLEVFVTRSEPVQVPTSLATSVMSLVF